MITVIANNVDATIELFLLAAFEIVIITADFLNPVSDCKF
jgi:hypothetical protein